MNFEEFLEKYQKVPVEEYPNQVPENPVVSVCVQTYQHAPYIRECLDSILMQKTDFPFEILLGEDASTDGTREICIEYAEKFPDKIRLFLHRRENNIEILGKPTGRFNLLYNIFSAKGLYIAICEGDDYWTKANKLANQVKFMNANPVYTISFHNVNIYNSKDSTLSHDYITREVPSTTNIYNLAKGNYIHTPSILFNSSYAQVLPEAITKTSIADYFLLMLLAQHGPIYKLEESMATYRIHEGG